MTKTLRVPLHYNPRKYQLPFLQAMEGGVKRAVLVWHRRAGKDLTAFNFLISMALRRPGNYYYYFPSFTQGRKTLWDGKDYEGTPFLDYIPKETIKGRPLDTEMKVVLFNKSIIQVMGTDDPNRLVGPNPIGVVLSEYPLQDPQAYELIKPILRENKGTAIFTYTPRGRNHGHKLYKMAQKSDDWFCELRTILDTRREDGSYVISPEDVEKEIAEGMDPDLAQQEYYCSWEGSMQGAYYARQLADARKEGRISKVAWEPGLPVHTAWDLGVGDSTSIWFIQTVRKEVRFINYLEGSGEGLPYYAKRLQEFPYVYGNHYGPHDIKVRELGTGHSRLEVAQELGINFDTVAKLPREDGIDAVRQIFPRSWFNEKNCERGLDGLASYRKEWDSTNQCFKTTPKHDWASNPADALRTFAVGFDDAPRLTQTFADSRFNPLQEPYEQDPSYESEFNVYV